MSPLRRAGTWLQAHHPRIARALGWSIVYATMPFVMLWLALSPAARRRMIAERERTP